jgi:hypothetical protein
VLERHQPPGFSLGSTTPTSVRAELPETVYINFVAKEIWLSFEFVTRQGMVEEKALIDSGANKNCIDIRTARIGHQAKTPTPIYGDQKHGRNR